MRNSETGGSYFERRRGADRDKLVRRDVSLRQHGINLSVLTAGVALVSGPQHCWWQRKVYDELPFIVQKADRQNGQLQLGVRHRLFELQQDRLDQLRARAIDELLLHVSPASSIRRVMLAELRNHCITMLSKEFDCYDPDDLLSASEPMQGSAVSVPFASSPYRRCRR